MTVIKKLILFVDKLINVLHVHGVNLYLILLLAEVLVNVLPLFLIDWR